MIRRILTAAVLIPVVLATIYHGPLPVFLLVVDLLLFLALRELMALLRRHGARPFLATYFCVLASPWIAVYTPAIGPAFLSASLLAMLASTLVLTRRATEGWPSIAGNLFAFGYLGLPLSLVATYHPDSLQSLGQAHRAHELVLVLGAIWAGDSAAYFVGRAVGRHRILPWLSPGKTLEGFAAGLIAPVLVVLLLGRHLFPDVAISFLLPAGIVIALFSIAGDLFESLLKRGAGLKDTSTLLPGHGGILDRIDSLLLAVPAYYVFSILLESATSSPP